MWSKVMDTLGIRQKASLQKLTDDKHVLQHRLRSEVAGLQRAARIAQRTNLMNEILGRVPGAGHESH